MSAPTTLDQVEETLADLRASMSAKFSLEEVRSLSLDMGIDHEDLPATKRAAVRELVLAVSRQHKLEGLVERCRELRPDSTWPNISNEETSLIARRSELAQRLSPSESKEREQQRILLTKVKNWWINAVLEKSVTEEELIEVGQKPYFEAIDHPWHEVLGTAIYDALSLTSQKDILTTFRESDCALLILGEPGTGKTTTMLRLARELIHTAEQEPDQPIPIVLNLAPWAEENPPLNDWVVGELTRRYQIPKEMGRRWLEDRRLVLLLDGLDTVPDRERAECVATINSFRAKNGLTGIVVCSRTREYEKLDTRLRMGGAILLQTLSAEQVDDYLAAGGPRLSGLRAAVNNDEGLREMAKAPLMLNVMRLAYRDWGEQEARELAQSVHQDGGSEKAARKRLFDTYVQRMTRRYGIDPEFPERQTGIWLAWLARQMTAHNQAMLLIEQMQPSWLATRGRRLVYLLMSRLAAGTLIAIFSWLFILVGTPLFNEDPANYAPIAESLSITFEASALLVQIALGLTMGAVVAMVDWLHFEGRFQQHGEAIADQRLGARHLATVGLLVWLLTTIFYRFPMNYDPLRAFYSGLFEAAGFGGLFGYVKHGQSYRTEIRTVEALSWSWRSAIRVKIPYLALALLAVVAIGLLYEAIAGLLLAAVLGLGAFLTSGLGHHRLEKKAWPNQGIWLSGRNSLLAAVIFGASFTPLALLYVPWQGNELHYRLVPLFGAAILLAASQLYGGIDVIKHFSMRLLLCVSGNTPWKYARFLDHCARLVLLYKVGGGYIFVHRLFQSYFAEKIWPDDRPEGLDDNPLVAVP